MKQFYLLLSGVLLSFSVYAQIDSVKVSIYESNLENGGWEFKTMYVDSFSNGKQIYHVKKSWAPNAWINSQLDTYSYDTSGNVTQKISSIWSNQWLNSRNWIYTYSQSNLITVLLQTWNGNTWIDSALETHYYDGSTDTLITTMIWINAAWTDYKKNVRVFDSYFFLSESTFSTWDTTQLLWINNLKYIYENDSTGRIISVIYQSWSGTQWENNDKDAYGYDPLGSITVHYDYWWEDTAWWLADQTTYYYNLQHQLESYYWDCFYGACGYATGNYQYDPQGNLIYSYGYSETMGGIPSEGRWNYYYFGNGAFPLYVITTSDFEKCSLDTIPIGAFAIGGNPPLQYHWTPAQGLSSDTIENPYVFTNTTTAYTLIVTDSSGNADTAGIGVTVLPNPVASISIQNIDTTSICNSALLIADSLEHIWCTWYFNGLQQVNAYGYLAAHFSIDENGFYKVSVQNVDGCNSYDSLEINFFTNPAPAVTITNQCNILAAQATGVQSFQWLKNNVIIPGAVYDTLNTTSNANYSVTVVDSNGCSNTSSQLFFAPMTIIFYAGQSCHDTCNGKASLSVYNATLPLQYLWSNGDTISHPTGLCAGIYAVTVTDARGCAVSKSDSVKYRSLLPLQIISSTVPDSASCFGIAVATINGNIWNYYSYAWSNGSTTYNSSNLCAGWNTVSVSDPYTHCTQIDSFSIAVVPNNDSCELTLTPWNPTCAGYCNGSVEITNRTGAAPYFTFWVNPDDGLIASYVENLCPGNYSAVLIDGNGCADTATAALVDPDSIDGEFTILFASPQQPCSTLVNLDLMNDNLPTSIFWQCSGAIGDQAYLCPGICNVIVEDNLGCMGYFSFDVPDSIVACSVIPSSVNVSCFGLCDGNSTAIANGVPPFNYQWSTGSSASTISSLCAGNYTVIMTDSIGCIDTATITITEPSALASTIISSYLNCQCTFIPIVTGGVFPYTYLWCNNNTAPILTDCTPGLCTLNITDANGCMLQDTILISPPPPVTLSPSITDATCNGCSDGTITANLTGGTPPYTYVLLQSGSTNSNGIFTGLIAGSYTLCATDSNACTVCTTLVVNEPPLACSVSIISVNNILCFGDCNGSLTAVANGVPPFNYTWCNGDNSATADSLCAGTCTVIMIDSVGCIDTAVATITEPPPLFSSYTTDFSNCNCLYTVIPNGGTPPYSYNWCDGSIGQTLSSCTSGLCIVYIVDANGCLVVDSILLNPPPPLSLIVQTTGTSCIGCSDGTIISGTSGGLPPYTYLLTPGNLICDTCLNLTAGVYTLCVTDSNNCTVCATDTVEDDPTTLNSPVSSNSFRIFPNPFNNYLQLDISHELILDQPNFTLKDVTGRIFLNVQLEQEHSRLSLKDISPGIYFYELIMHDKTVFKGILIATD